METATMTTDQDEQLCTASQAALLRARQGCTAGVTAETIMTWHRDGRLPAVAINVNGKPLFRRADVLAVKPRWPKTRSEPTAT